MEEFLALIAVFVTEAGKAFGKEFAATIARELFSTGGSEVELRKALDDAVAEIKSISIKR
ncbi:hypothetical protein U8P73_35995 (plasmid) [Rhizobium beringeri]|uniref:hypothetical protein n=1 Tax=Rhizobium beringeri TaxID=3019934 RepID=UPI002DDD59CD|nr:hypothetical protein [Rhizobium beringeri]WSG93554.1 hypothetical protein U8P73_35995 [Rhizobium beringeri]